MGSNSKALAVSVMPLENRRETILYIATAADRLGYAKEVEAVLAANPGREPAVVPAGAESLLEHLTVFGTPVEARARLAHWYGAGAALPVLLLRPHLTREQIDFTLEAFCA